MTNCFFPLTKLGTNTVHNIEVTNTSGGPSNANYFQVNNAFANKYGVLVLSGWVDGKSPYSHDIDPGITSYAGAVAAQASGYPFFHIGKQSSEITIPPPYAVSSFSVWHGAATLSWHVTYGRLKDVPNLSLNNGGPTGHSL